MIRAAALIAIAACAVSAVACGGGSSSVRDEVQDAFDAWTADIAAGDGESGCKRLTPKARRQFASQFYNEILGGLPMTCAEAVEHLHALSPRAELRALDAITIRRVEVKGDRAIVHDRDVHVPGAVASEKDETPTVFVRVRGRWLLEDLG